MTSSAPARTSATPTMSEPASADHARASPPPSAAPSAPPWSAPSATMRPTAPTTSPVRNGRRSTSALRTSISAPTTIRTSGTTWRGRAERRRAASRRASSRPAAVPAEPEDRREQEPDRDHPEAPELGMVMPAGLLRFLRTRAGCAACAFAPAPRASSRRHGLSASRAAGVSCGAARVVAVQPARARASSTITSASARLPKPRVSTFSSSRSL